ncbi:MAG: alpha/beta fold hydrolase [Pseudomonadota bacterium]
MTVTTLEDVQTLEDEAQIVRTRCGDGDLIWRRWGDGAPVVLLHGGSGSWLHWVRTIPHLRRNRTVWAVDLPGLGDSAMPPPPLDPYSCATVVADGFRKNFEPGAGADLVGFSFGAHVGTIAAASLTDRLRSFTVLGTSALGIPRPMLDAFPKERSSMDMSARREVHRRVLEILMISKPERIDDLAVSLQQRNVGKARFRSRKFAPTDNVARGLADVHVPLRSIWGRNDVIAHPDVETCLDVLRQHHPELVARIIPDAGHWVMFEQAAAFNEALDDMLAEPV